MYGKFQDFLKTEIQSIKDAGLYKTERLIATPQGAEIKLTTGETVLNFCANNYLGLSSDPRVIEGAKKGLDARGYGMSSVRFICGTQDIHKELEANFHIGVFVAVANGFAETHPINDGSVVQFVRDDGVFLAE